MGRKMMGFQSLFKASSGGPPPPSSCASTTYSAHSWPWPSCKHPRTRSFRAAGAGEDVYKTVNSVYYLDTAPESSFTNSSEELASEISLSTTASSMEEDQGGAAASAGGDPSAEAVIRSLLQSDCRSGGGGGRLFFEPGAATSSSILEESKPGGFPFKESVVMAMDSEDPYMDFRVSMEEVVAAHGVRDWDCLEELLDWYLRVNGKTTHGFIVGAFIDLLLDLFSPPSSSSSTCSSSSSPPPSDMSDLDHAVDGEEGDGKQRLAIEDLALN